MVLKGAVLTSVGVVLLAVVAHELFPQSLKQLAHVLPFLQPLGVVFHGTTVFRTLFFGDDVVARGEERLFTAEELSTYTGEDGKGPYLAILGQVYDVSKGKKHYGVGGHYSFFAGRDASRGFVTGDFSSEALTDDIDGLSPADYLGLREWQRFYEKDYKYVGKVIGRYYEESGAPTAYWKKAHALFDAAHNHKADEEKEKLRFPPCNVEWSKDSGRRFWCTVRSGGVQRSWEGVPRRMFFPGKEPRCVCVQRNDADLSDPRLQEYPGCPPRSTSCRLED